MLIRVGVIVRTTDKLLDSTASAPKQKGQSDPIGLGEEEEEQEEEEEDQTEPTKLVEEVAQFDEMQIWGHEAVPEEDDAFVRGMEEWIGFAEAMHSHEASQPTKGP